MKLGIQVLSRAQCARTLQTTDARQTTDRQTDRQTYDGRASSYSEREHDFTFANNINHVQLTSYNIQLSEKHCTTTLNSGITIIRTTMWANAQCDGYAQCDGRPAEYRWRPVFNAAKFGSRPLLECRAVTVSRCETR